MQIVVDGTLTHYHEINPNATKTILFLHGWANTSENWLAVAGHLPTNIRYLLLDLPGFGKTRFLSGKPGVPEYSDFIAQLIQQLGLDKPLIFGHSFGGAIALDLALKHPQLVSSLILLSPAGIGLHQRFQNVRVSFVRTLNFIEQKINIPFTKPLLKKISSPEYAKAIREHRDLFHNILNYDLTTEIYKIDVPIHLLWGEKDKVIPLNRFHLKMFLPQAHLTIIPNVGHLPQITHPLIFTNVLSEILLTLHPNTEIAIP